MQEIVEERHWAINHAAYLCIMSQVNQIHIDDIRKQYIFLWARVVDMDFT